MENEKYIKIPKEVFNNFLKVMESNKVAYFQNEINAAYEQLIINAQEEN